MRQRIGPARANTLVAPGLLATALFLAAVAVSAIALGGVDAATLAVLIGVPLLAAGAGAALVRALRIDAAIARRAFLVSVRCDDLIAVITSCARDYRAHGAAGLVPHMRPGQNGLLADALRLLAAGAEARLMRDALNRRLDRGLQHAARTQRILTVVARLAPVVALPVIGAVSVSMLRTGVEPGWSAASATAIGAALAVVLFPILALETPARAEGQRRIARRALIGTLVITGVTAIREGEDAPGVERRLLDLLPRGPLTVRATAA